MRDYKQLLDECMKIQHEQCMKIQHELRYRARVMEMALDMATEFLGELFGSGAFLGSASASKEEWCESLLRAAEKKLGEQEYASDTEDIQDDLTSVSNKYQKNT